MILTIEMERLLFVLLIIRQQDRVFQAHNRLLIATMAKALAAVTLATLGLFAAMNLPEQSATSTLGQQLQKSAESFLEIINANCTESLAVECVTDIELTVKACSKAAESKGSDVVADLKCAKDLLADKKNCWPCICFQAKKQGWHVIGC